MVIIARNSNSPNYISRKEALLKGIQLLHLEYTSISVQLSISFKHSVYLEKLFRHKQTIFQRTDMNL